MRSKYSDTDAKQATFVVIPVKKMIIPIMNIPIFPNSENIRELNNTVERMVNFIDKPEINAEDLDRIVPVPIIARKIEFPAH